jgi:hypothetical protein
MAVAVVGAQDADFLQQHPICMPGSTPSLMLYCKEQNLENSNVSTPAGVETPNAIHLHTHIPDVRVVTNVRVVNCIDYLTDHLRPSGSLL